MAMEKVSWNENQVQQWIEAARGIRKRFGVENALAYVIGEKFYDVAYIVQSSHKIITAVEVERKNPDYNPIRHTKLGKEKYVHNWDKTYEQTKELIVECSELLLKFTSLIQLTFAPSEIWAYFKSNPRLGVHRHISTEEQYKFMLQHGGIDNSLDSEIDDALILGDMMRYFGIS